MVSSGLWSFYLCFAQLSVIKNLLEKFWYLWHPCLFGSVSRSPRITILESPILFLCCATLFMQQFLMLVHLLMSHTYVLIFFHLRTLSRHLFPSCVNISSKICLSLVRLWIGGDVHILISCSL